MDRNYEMEDGKMERRPKMEITPLDRQKYGNYPPTSSTSGRCPKSETTISKFGEAMKHSLAHVQDLTSSASSNKRSKRLR